MTPTKQQARANRLLVTQAFIFAEVSGNQTEPVGAALYFLVADRAPV